jgi:5-methylcytosine-specific restriction endonuclease McrA
MRVVETLALSAGYEPLARIPWQRAVTLLFQGKVEVIEEYQDRSIRSVTFEIRMPSVVRFLRALRNRRRAVKFSRENVYARDGGRCSYCRARVARHEATYDHVVPRNQGGRTDWTNVVIACVPCNQRKGGRTPEQAGMRLLATPARPRKLPDTVRITLTFVPGMPASWRSWLRDVAYWHGELECLRISRVFRMDSLSVAIAPPLRADGSRFEPLLPLREA